MAVTRYFPPFYPGESIGSKLGHMKMEPNANGPYVLYTSYEKKVNHLKSKILELEAKISELETEK